MNAHQTAGKPFAELAGADSRRLEQTIDRARGFVAKYTGIIGWPENDLDALDTAYVAWSRDRDDRKPHPAEVAEICGVAVGWLVARRVGLKWMVTTDPAARALALVGRSASGGDVSVVPVQVVTKRMTEGMTGFLSALATGLCEYLADALAS